MATERTQYLYRLRDAAGRLLYVGVTWNPRARMAEHRRYNSVWFAAVDDVSMTEYATRHEAERAERDAITRERPAMNFMDSAEHRAWRAAGLPLRRIAVEDQRWVTAMRIAHARDESLNEVIRDALARYVEQHEHELSPAALSAVPD